MTSLFLLFFVIFLEGYIVLSAELLSIRLAVPYVGSGTDTISIIIAAVLMPLAVGYYAGGQFQRYRGLGGMVTVRRKLLRNIFVASLFLLLGLSYVTATTFFAFLNQNVVHNRLIVTTLYAGIFLVTPVYLLAQTIPLVSHFFRKEKLSYITGKMLFFSTLGSFMGAVFSTLVLMAFIGVHYTVVVTIACLCFLYWILSRQFFSRGSFLMLLVLLAAIGMNNDYIMKLDDVVGNNQYNIIKVKDMGQGNTRILSLNNNTSSAYTDTSGFGENALYYNSTHGYVNYINRNFIDPIIGDTQVRDFLIIGAGGFTIGIDDTHNNYTFIDLDKSLKDISEEHFLKRKLTDNKKFEATPARAFISKAIHENKTFDMIVLDVFLGDKTIPEHLVTQEFYTSVKKVLKKDGIFLVNFIMPADFNTAFSIRVDNTLRRVFPNVSRQIIKDFDAWNSGSMKNANVLYIYFNKEETVDGYYSDNINRAYYDREKIVE